MTSGIDSCSGSVDDSHLIAFGPIPSRRLGHSLGINHIQPKYCSYSCRYCQVGRTRNYSSERRAFFSPEKVAEVVSRRVAVLRSRSEPIDYLSFVPDGEPTLDVNLGRIMELLRPLGIPLAVLTNSTLLWQPCVREDLALADLVCVKVDTLNEDIWRRLNQPDPALDLATVLEGIQVFAHGYSGRLFTDTMLVRGCNDSVEQVRKVAGFVAPLKPHRAFLSVPVRPPAESGVHRPEQGDLMRAYNAFAEELASVECLFEPEADIYASTGDPAGDLLSATAVHPIRFEAAVELLRRGNADVDLLRELIADGKLAEIRHEGARFLVRRPPDP